MGDNASQPTLLGLPAELSLHLLAFLEPIDLACVAQTCRALAVLSYDDQIWQPLVNRNLPVPIIQPTPLKSYRELYVAHHPHWFLPRHKFWFSDSFPHGKLVVSQYDPQRGSISAYAMAAVRGPHSLQFWEKDREVIIHSFQPRISVDLEKPVVKLELDSLRTDDQPDNEPSDRGYGPPSLYSKEVLMDTTHTPGLYSSFMLCHTLPAAAVTEQTALWPPRRFPATTRVRNESGDGYQSTGHRPTRLQDVSQHNFRVRKWAEYNGRRALPNLIDFRNAALGARIEPYFAAHLASTVNGGMGYQMNEEISTFATLPESAYMPTAKKPWQGIWCGDYSGHGCEFLIVTQPDKRDETPLPQSMDWLTRWFRGGRRGSGSSSSSYASAQEEMTHAEPSQDNAEAPIDTQAVLGGFTEEPKKQSVHEVIDDPDAPSGRLEAIKLTGDPNIPRGHYTFIAPDIGSAGLLRVADEEVFRGARIVRSAGHIAGRGFREDQYTPSQLIMISHDRLAQFWEGFGHISFFQRVDIDALIRPGASGHQQEE